MKLIGNILWLLLGGVELAIGYALAGLISFALIFTIPFGVASFRLAGYALWPFGRVLVRKPGAGVGSGLANLVWMLIAGVWLALGHLLAALINAITIIGIPFSVAHLKLAGAALTPFGHEVAPIGSAGVVAEVRQIG
ncbi:MAG TPA: YccF domain-containing protein [Acidimicrobiia bacterium]|nr:YccF domain-containing protein [Acidimicrobiia bacterium]